MPKVPKSAFACAYQLRKSGLGLRVLEDVGAEYYRRRWPEPIGRKMDVTTGERVCLAEVRHEPTT